MNFLPALVGSLTCNVCYIAAYFYKPHYDQIIANTASGTTLYIVSPSTYIGFGTVMLIVGLISTVLVNTLIGPEE
jgi:hypothetical protein